MTINDGSKESTEATALECAAMAAGFVLEETGGGCRAYVKREGGISIYLTAYGPDVPDTLDTPEDDVSLTSCYDATCGTDPIIQREYPTARAALAAVDGVINDTMAWLISNAFGEG